MAGGLDEIMRRRDQEGSSIAAFEGEITNGANDPTDEVSAKELHGTKHVHKECRWAPRAEPDGEGGVQLSYPSRGDRCLIILSDTNEPWIEWTPYV